MNFLKSGCEIETRAKKLKRENNIEKMAAIGRRYGRLRQIAMSNFQIVKLRGIHDIFNMIFHISWY